jgi:hypothetical protein
MSRRRQLVRWLVLGTGIVLSALGIGVWVASTRLYVYWVPHETDDGTCLATYSVQMEGQRLYFAVTTLTGEAEEIDQYKKSLRVFRQPAIPRWTVERLPDKADYVSHRLDAPAASLWSKLKPVRIEPPRSFPWRDGRLSLGKRSFDVATWLPFVLFSVLTAVSWWRGRRLWREGHCQQCGYNLAANVSGICPECGTAIDKDSKVGTA